MVGFNSLVREGAGFNSFCILNNNLLRLYTTLQKLTVFILIASTKESIVYTSSLDSARGALKNNAEGRG